MTDSKYYQRCVTAFKAINDENGNSILNLNSTVSLYEKGVEKYKDIPESVVYSIKRLVTHTKNLQNIITGKTDVFTVEECDKIRKDSEEFWKRLGEIAEQYGSSVKLDDESQK